MISSLFVDFNYILMFLYYVFIYSKLQLQELEKKGMLHEKNQKVNVNFHYRHIIFVIFILKFKFSQVKNLT